MTLDECVKYLRKREIQSLTLRSGISTCNAWIDASISAVVVEVYYRTRGRELELVSRRMFLVEGFQPEWFLEVVDRAQYDMEKAIERHFES